MTDSTDALYVLQKSVIDAGLERSAEFNEIRFQLKQCWGDAQDLLQQCYAVTSTVSLLENEAPTANYNEVVTLMRELVDGCEQCHGKAQVLAYNHSIQIERYQEFEATVRHLALLTSNHRHANNEVEGEAISTFISAYKTLQGKVDEMVIFFAGQVQACNLYLEAAQGHNTGVTLDQANQFALEWARVRPKIKDAKFDVSNACKAITIPPTGAVDAITNQYPRGTEGNDPSVMVKCENILTISE
jgi:hypothetical protein